MNNKVLITYSIMLLSMLSSSVASAGSGSKTFFQRENAKEERAAAQASVQEISPEAVVHQNRKHKH